MKNVKLVGRCIASAALLLLVGVGATVLAKRVSTSPVVPSMRGISSGKGVVAHGYYSPMRNKGKVRAYAAPAADAWTKALPDSLMCTLLESDSTAFNPNYSGFYTFDEEKVLIRLLTTSNTPRARGGMAYGDLSLLWTYKNNVSEEDHVWYTRSYNVKKYSSGSLNLTNQKYIVIDDTQDKSMIATAMAYDPETGAVFGCFNNKTGDKYEFAFMDHRFVDNGRSKAICEIAEPWHACGFTDKGQMYVLLDDGFLATVDKNTGVVTKVKDLGLAGNDSYTGFLDTRDNVFYIYWSNREKSEAALYVVDINNGCALYKAFTMPFYAKMGSMVSLHNPISNSAPGTPTVSDVTFQDGSLKGKVKFTAPAKTLDGKDLSGELDYSVAAGGKVLATGKVQPGAEAEADINLPSVGAYFVRVRLSNSAGTGLWSIPKTYIWAGADVPVAPTGVTASYDRQDSLMKLSWNPVTEGVHKGSVKPSDVRYSVVKYVNGVDTVKVADSLTNAEWSETIAWPDNVTTVKYEVYATYEGADSEYGASNIVTLGTINAPWKEDFDDANSLDRFTAYNDGKTPSGTGNATQNVWFRYDDKGTTTARVYSTSKKNHYLVTPPIHLEPGKSYIFHAAASCFASSYDEKMEVLMGKSPKIEDLTTVLVPETSVKAIHSKPTMLAKEITVEEEGEYYIAFHATSKAYKRYIELDDIEIEAPYATNGPNVSTDLTLDGFRYDGSTNVTVSFKAPAIDMQGRKLTSLTKIEVERDGEIVKTFRNPTFGETYTFEDACPERGTYKYKVTAYNSYGPGKYVMGEVKTGVDYGAKVTDVVITETSPGIINLKWKPATTDVQGREIDPSLIKYTVILNSRYYVGDEFLPSTTNELEFRAVNEGYQANCYCTIYSYTDAGYNMIGTSSFNPDSYAQSITIPVGDPYSMPVFEDGRIAVNWGYETSGGQWWGNWFPDWSVVNPDNATALGITTADNDGYCFAWPVSFDPNYGTEHTIFEGAKSNFYSGKIHVEDSDLSAFSFQYYVEPPTEEGEADEYIFYPIVHDPYEGDVALSGPISTKDAPGPGWHKVMVSLDKYRGKDVQIGLHVEFTGHYKRENKYFLIDDLQIRQFADHDMMAMELETPMLEPGEENTLSAGIRNIGYETAEAFVVELYRNGEKVSESEPVTLRAGEKGNVMFKQTPGLFWEPTQNFHFNIAYNKDQLLFNNESAKVETEVLESRLPAVNNLAAEADDMTVTLSWTAPDIASGITDDCENYTPFSINRAGRWSFIDADGLTTYPIVGDQFPGFGEPSAFVVWQNINEERNFTHSGNKCFAAFPVDAVSDDDVNDDWLISPLLNGTEQTVSFWALGKFGSSLWGSHQIEFLVSSTGKEMADFTRVGDVITLPDAYTQYSFNVPEGTKYFAIRYIQAAVSGIFIDDITFSQYGNDAVLVGYDVYCDGKKINDTLLTQPGFKHTLTDEGSHTYHVVACYNEGLSDLSNAAQVAVTGIANVADLSATVYTTPGRIHIDNAANSKVSVVNSQGITLYSNDCCAASETINVTPGVYVVATGKTLHKVIVK